MTVLKSKSFRSMYEMDGYAPDTDIAMKCVFLYQRLRIDTWQAYKLHLETSQRLENAM